MKTNQVVADGHGMSHRDIAAAMGLSLARVQQLEKSALRKLRDGLGVVLRSDIEADEKHVEKRRLQRLRAKARRGK